MVEHVNRSALVALSGPDESGKFPTAPAEEYPAKMCQFISEAVVDFVLGAVTSGQFKHITFSPLEDERIAGGFAPLDPFLESQQDDFGADFVAGTARGGFASGRVVT